MSLAAAIAAITSAYKQDGAFATLFFPGDPTPAEPVDLPEQFNEWPVLIVFEDSGFIRQGAHGSDTFWATTTLRIELHDARTDQNDAVNRLRQYRPHVPRVFFARFYGDRFGGTVPFLGDPETRGGQAPLRWELRPDNWGGVPTISLVYFADITIEEATAG